MSTKIGFIGQGWIGKNYADDFEKRGYQTVRYALEEAYVANKDAIARCRITLIAVPTPTTPDGFDDSALVSALAIIGEGNIAVIKSTTIPGRIKQLQDRFPKIIILHSPEFLVEKTAAHDAANPQRNIIGMPMNEEKFSLAAKEVLEVLPNAPYQKIMTSDESELVKYAGNCFLYSKVVFMNILFDVVEKSGSNWSIVREAMIADSRIGKTHTEPVYDSGRGAGGHCFIKDFEAFRQYYSDLLGHNKASELLSSMKDYNNSLLIDSGKNLDLLTDIYGSEIVGKGGLD